jgi:hypothetical protein
MGSRPFFLSPAICHRCLMVTVWGSAWGFTRPAPSAAMVYSAPPCWHPSDQLPIDALGAALVCHARRFSAHQIVMTAWSPTAGQRAIPAIRNIDPETANTVNAPTL